MLPLRPRRAWYAALAALLVLGVAAAPALAGPPTVRVVRLAGSIDPVSAPWIVDQIHDAARSHDAAVVLQVDTPGGNLESMRQIVAAEVNTPVPVLVWVGPAGARAASAGFYVLQAADIAAMAPLSNTGSATPISSGGSNIGSDLRHKIVNDALAQIRSLARQHHRNVQLAEDAVRPRSTACRECPRNYTADEARRQHVIDLVAPDLPALLSAVDGRRAPLKGLTLHTAGAVLDQHELPLFSRLLEVLIDPNLLVLLFLGGIAGIVFELSHPGVVLPGLLGGVSLILALLGLTVIPFTWAGAALLLGGVVLLALEAHVPAHGAFASVGLLGVAAGGLMLFQVEGSPYRASAPLVLGTVAVLAALLFLVARKAVAARHLPPATGGGGMLGEHAVVRTPLTPRGHVFAHGELWAAVADGEPAPQVGDEVVIVGVDGLLLRVAATRTVSEPVVEPLPSGA